MNPQFKSYAWLLAAVLACVSGDADACSRRWIFPPAVLVAMADVIVEARVEKIDDLRVTVSPVVVRKGVMADRQVEIAGLDTPSPDVIDSCDTNIVQGKTYLFLAYDRLPGQSHLTAVDWQGVFDLSTAAELLKTTGVSTSWVRGRDGVWLKAAVAKAIFPATEPFVIYLAFRNAGATARTIRFRRPPSPDGIGCSLEGEGIAKESGMPFEIESPTMISGSELELKRGEVLQVNYFDLAAFRQDSPANQGTGIRKLSMKPGRQEIRVSCRAVGMPDLRATGLRFEVGAP